MVRIRRGRPATELQSGHENRMPTISCRQAGQAACSTWPPSATVASAPPPALTAQDALSIHGLLILDRRAPRQPGRRRVQDQSGRLRSFPGTGPAGPASPAARWNRLIIRPREGAEPHDTALVSPFGTLASYPVAHTAGSSSRAGSTTRRSKTVARRRPAGASRWTRWPSGRHRLQRQRSVRGHVHTTGGGPSSGRHGRAGAAPGSCSSPGCRHARRKASRPPRSAASSPRLGRATPHVTARDGSRHRPRRP